uniref:Phosphofructokinase domain-containing protein n=2 Tax=Coccolithus braarudii TaxID=221442 RepID=A0A7S0Q368_9EUKA|mmetsp:Transcript_29613/g.63740  ORF Transcript_29613/g.63740 Transcript_29613/m.63740 type:complete len:549 (+) Transcript_29613:29-1675(+)|eukprot:CAMPEP_0183335484 /NCGR_PEP_ID=MMETSP0164_2-20130417/3781_1 /TAXON_ID=221442 /ORGANISM="Coccolithus pelagicus ssp braarudi, Strain PLY182g" /LENGTH=548 /DNA_ID=CAMNT_0025504865 /DNA_START=28 /DNA_END=1674 /DNA_ORIENTATION=+
MGATSDKRELALALSAGVGIGIVGAYLLVRRMLSTDSEEEFRSDGYVWKRPSLAPTEALLAHDNEIPKTDAPAQKVLARARRKSMVVKNKVFESSSHLAANHLSTWQEDPESFPDWPREKGERGAVFQNPMATKWPGMNFLNPNEKIMGHIILNDSKASTRSNTLAGGTIRANACEKIFWEPESVKAAMVTCGGLCPGLNSIIRGLTKCLLEDYGIRQIFGVTAGYNGLSDPEQHEWMELNSQVVDEIHMKGGSILKAGRGGFDAPKICTTLRAKGINVLFVIGGDGTQYAGHLLFEEACKQQLSVSVVGVPKSIDNDVLFVDRTFGFNSAVASAAEVIRNGWVEATSCFKGVGIIKLMGRDAGFVAAHAALASNLVDLVLVPEVYVDLQDIKDWVDSTVARKGHMVIVVAEGAAQEHVATGQKDATGHAVYGDIGVFLRDMLNKHLKPQGGRTFYIDPSYIIRSVAITPNDHIYCSRLANNAVHTAMRGYTGVCVGAIHNVIVILKSKLIASGKKQLKLSSSTWQTCVQMSNMPASLSGIKPKAPKA